MVFRPHKRRRTNGMSSGTIAHGSSSLYNALGAAVGSAYRYYAGSSRTRTKRKNSSGTGVTFQRDSINVYRKKRQPKAKRNRWKSFIKKVDAATKRHEGSLIRVFNKQLQAGAYAGTPGQKWAAIHMYTYAGLDPTILTPNESNTNDIEEFFTGMQSFPNNNYKISASSKLKFYSMVCDVTFTNESTLPELFEGSRTLEVDLYLLDYSDFHREDHPHFANVLSESNSDMLQLTTSSFADIESRGVTPFELPTLMRTGGFTIISKKKYLLGQGQSFTYQYRDPKNYIISNRSYDQGDYRGRGTKTLLVICKSVNSSLPPANQILRIGCTTVYKATASSTETNDRQSYDVL